MTEDCKGFVVLTFAALVVDVVLIDEVAVVVPHCELAVVLGFDTVAAVVDVLDSRVIVAFHLAVYLAFVAVNQDGTNQGDSLAMFFYALGTSMLLEILKMTSPAVRQVSLAGDITDPDKLNILKTWWDNVISEGKEIS